MLARDFLPSDFQAAATAATKSLVVKTEYFLAKNYFINFRVFSIGIELLTTKDSLGERVRRR